MANNPKTKTNSHPILDPINNDDEAEDLVAASVEMLEEFPAYIEENERDNIREALDQLDSNLSRLRAYLLEEHGEAN